MKTPEELDPTGKFVPYFGNHHEGIARCKWQYGGGVSFKRHIGRPLSEALWEDLHERLMMTRLLVYRHDDSRWCMGWGAGTAIVDLDEAGLVADIDWHPYYPHVNKAADDGKRDLIAMQEPGGCIGHTARLARVDFG